MLDGTAECAEVRSTVASACVRCVPLRAFWRDIGSGRGSWRAGILQTRLLRGALTDFWFVTRLGRSADGAAVCAQFRLQKPIPAAAN